MPVWLVSLTNLDNVRRIHERILWGFWDREAGEKQRRNWKLFIMVFNRIKPFRLLGLPNHRHRWNLWLGPD